MLKVFNQNWLNPNQQCAVLVKQMVDMLKNDEDLEIPRAECIYVDGKWETLVTGPSHEAVMEQLERSKGVISLWKSTSRDTDICLVVKRGLGTQFTNRKRGVSFNHRKNVTTEDLLFMILDMSTELDNVSSSHKELLAGVEFRKIWG